MDELEAQLAAYYDREGTARRAMPLGVGRLEGRGSFVELTRREGRRTVLDVGSGPGRDALALTADGLDVTAVDRSSGHVRLATRAGVRALVASVLALPFPPASFDAGWTMSTLVHVPDDRWDRAMASLTAVLRPGAPLAIGLWGGVDEEHWQPPQGGLPTRFFSRRSHERVRSMLTRHGDVESFTTFAGNLPGWDYQFAVLRLT